MDFLQLYKGLKWVKIHPQKLQFFETLFLGFEKNDQKWRFLKKFVDLLSIC